MSLYWNGVNLVKTGLRFARYKRKQKQKANHPLKPRARGL